MEDLIHDINEIDHLLTLAKRHTVIETLKNKKSQLEQQLAALTQVPTKIEQKQKVEEQKNVLEEDPLFYKAITKYSFEQEGKKVKIYVLLDKVGELPKENITVKFDSQSFDLKIKGYQNQNLRLAIKKLHEAIDVHASSFAQKNNSVILTLVKKENKFWNELQYKESALKPEKFEKNEDPQASLMNMMKEMYNSGDDEMKKQIAKAWTESKNKTDPGFGGL